MNLKFLSGVATPAVCAAIAVALSQQAGAKEADIPRSDYPVSQSVSFLTPEQQAKAQKLIEERQKNPPKVRELTPEQQAKRDKLVNELMSQ